MTNYSFWRIFRIFKVLKVFKYVFSIPRMIRGSITLAGLYTLGKVGYELGNGYYYHYSHKQIPDLINL